MHNIHQKIDSHIGKRVHQRRNELKFSLEKLNLRSGVSIAELHRIEEGKAKVTAAQVLNISHALHTHISYFFENYNSNQDIERLIVGYLWILENPHRQRILRLIETMNATSETGGSI